ncbi:MAG: bifunctional tetrahydrofolate synthase/dihydrofolate synthase [Gammaproteobacteria bacterium]|nr:bifunctional tetrahydrofolate synthase/dihydrofolate synthase [Gammaproteobacteria bacterium]
MCATRSLSDWLSWQESLHPAKIDLGLERVARVAKRMQLRPGDARVLTVAGTNGKGSTVRFVDVALRAAGLRTGVYTSPHLIRYNERVRVAGAVASDAELVAAFEAIELARAGDTLTYFEFGTLAAAWLFSRAELDAWILEVGLGGRLDAVNVFEPDVSLITTIALDHQNWLGNDVESIAAEKAGIMRAGKPVLFGDWPVPQAVESTAAGLGALLSWFGRDFGYRRRQRAWTWWSARRRISGLPYPDPADDAQLRNASLALAGLEALHEGWPTDEMALASVQEAAPTARFQRLQRDHEWVLDVAHNPQAAAVLATRLAELPGASSTTVVLALLGDKDLEGIAAALGPDVDRWIVVGLDSHRARAADELAKELAAIVDGPVLTGETATRGLQLAEREAPTGSRIVVCGSFQLVGPALEWLGLGAE